MYKESLQNGLGAARFVVRRATTLPAGCPEPPIGQKLLVVSYTSIIWHLRDLEREADYDIDSRYLREPDFELLAERADHETFRQALDHFLLRYFGANLNLRVGDLIVSTQALPLYQIAEGATFRVMGLGGIGEPCVLRTIHPINATEHRYPPVILTAKYFKKLY